MMRKVMLCVVLCALALGTGPRQARADCGSVPFYAPAVSHFDITTNNDGPKDLDFDPLKVTVFEPKQRAIILWNGEEETLLLSTDQRASRKSAVLEVIPLPGKPTVKLGSFRTFEVAQNLLIQKNMWATAHPGMRAELVKAPAEAARIEFQRKLGAHDLTVAEVLDAGRFTDFVQQYLKDHYQTPTAPIRPEFISIIQSYLDQGFKWFAFDVITLDTANASREPIEYRFKSDKVFYPLRISSLEGGKTEADLLVFTSGDPTRFTGIEQKRIETTPAADVTAAELRGINGGWNDFFGVKKTVRMTRWSIKGKSAELLKDVEAR
jgi:hypothetical protein